MVRTRHAYTRRAAVGAAACCLAIVPCWASAQARTSKPLRVSPAGMQVQQTDVAVGGSRTVVLMAGYTTSRGSQTWSLQARLGGMRGLGAAVRLVSGDVEAPRVAVGGDGTAVAAWTDSPPRGAKVLRVAIARPGHNFGRAQTLAQATSLGLGGIGVTGTGRAVVTWRPGTGGTPVQVAIAAPGRSFGAAQTLGVSRQSTPSVAVAPNDTIVVTWLDTPRPPLPPPAPQGPGSPARVLARTLAAGQTRFGSTTELATLGLWSSGPAAASGPGGAAVTWRQTPAEQRVATLGALDAFVTISPLAAPGPPSTGDATLSDHLALGMPLGQTTAALWLETPRSGTAVVKTAATHRLGANRFSAARTLSASGWVAWPPAAVALPDRSLAAWTETRGDQSRVRLAVRPMRFGWTALAPLPTRSLNALTLTAAASSTYVPTSSRYAVVAWIQNVGTSATSLGGGQLYMTTYRPQS